MLIRSTAPHIGKYSLHREKKELEKKRKMSQIKIHKDLPQGELSQKEERLREKRKMF